MESSWQHKHDSEDDKNKDVPVPSRPLFAPIPRSFDAKPADRRPLPFKLQLDSFPQPEAPKVETDDEDEEKDSDEAIIQAYEAEFEESHDHEPGNDENHAEAVLFAHDDEGLHGEPVDLPLHMDPYAAGQHAEGLPSFDHAEEPPFAYPQNETRPSPVLHTEPGSTPWFIPERPAPPNESRPTPPPLDNGGRPPTPPFGPPTAYEEFDHNEPPEPGHNGAENDDFLPPTPVMNRERVVTEEEHNQALYRAERRNHRAFWRGVIVTALVARYRGNKLRQAHTQDLAKQKETFTSQLDAHRSESRKLRTQVEELQYQAAAPPARYERPPAAVPVPVERISQPPRAQEQAPAQQASPEDVSVEQTIVLQPHERLVRNGSFNVVVDTRTGQEVRGAISYGEAYHQERAQEVIGERFGVQDTQAAAGGTVSQDLGRQAGHWSTQAAISSSTLRSSVQGSAQQDSNNPVKSAVSNPWVWVMMVVLLATFFAAALL